MERILATTSAHGSLEPGVNRQIYTDSYSPAQLDGRPESPLDRGMVELRHELVQRHGRDRDVLDVGCGSGAYLLPHLGEVRSAVGIDFAPNMLAAIRERLGGEVPGHLRLFEADAREIPLPNASVDLAYSFTTLYYVPQVELAIAEVARVLRPGGHAVLELGALRSLNTLISNVQHRDAGWAKPYHVPYRALRRHVRDAGLEVEEWRTFQLVPMYGAPRKLLPLVPLCSPRWKAIAGRKVRGRMLDERVSSLPFLRPVSFRHMVIARRP